MKTLNQIIPNWKNKGIFTILSETVTLPWQSADISRLDVLYHGHRSGRKFIGSLMLEYETEEGNISESDLKAIAQSVYYLNADKWANIWKTWNLDYNPIENYDRNEDFTDTRTPDLTTTTTTDGKNVRTPDLNTTIETSGDDTTTRTGTNKTTYDNIKDTSQENTFTYAYDTSEGTPTPTDTTKNENTRTGGITETPNLTSTISHGMMTETEETGTDTQKIDNIDTRTEKGTDTTHRTGRAHGNIGVTTTQQMMMEEYNIRKRRFFDMVMEDMDEILLLHIY